MNCERIFKCIRNTINILYLPIWLVILFYDDHEIEQNCLICVEFRALFGFNDNYRNIIGSTVILNNNFHSNKNMTMDETLSIT